MFFIPNGVSKLMYSYIRNNELIVVLKASYKQINEFVFLFMVFNVMPPYFISLPV